MQIDSFLSSFDFSRAKLSSSPTQRGVVFAAGGVKFLTNVFLSVRALRRVGCTLPVEIWYNGDLEISADVIAALEALPGKVRCRDLNAAHESYLRGGNGRGDDDTTGLPTFFDDRYFAQNRPDADTGLWLQSGYQVKPFAVLYSYFDEVLFLDAENTVLRDPSFLFDSPEYRRTGSLFWPEFWSLSPTSPMYDVFKVPATHRPLRQIESGQLLIDKRRRFRELALTCFVNSGDRRRYYYAQLFGDKDLWQLSWLRAGDPNSFALSTWSPALAGVAHNTGRDADTSSSKSSPSPSPEATQSVFCGVGLIHFAPSDNESSAPLFLHATFAERDEKPRYDTRFTHMWRCGSDVHTSSDAPHHPCDTMQVAINKDVVCAQRTPQSFGYTFEVKSSGKVGGNGVAHDGRTEAPIACEHVIAGQTTLCKAEESLIADLQMLHAQHFYQGFVDSKK